MPCQNQRGKASQRLFNRSRHHRVQYCKIPIGVRPGILVVAHRSRSDSIVESRCFRVDWLSGTKRTRVPIRSVPGASDFPDSRRSSSTYRRGGTHSSWGEFGIRQIHQLQRNAALSQKPSALRPGFGSRFYRQITPSGRHGRLHRRHHGCPTWHHECSRVLRHGARGKPNPAVKTILRFGGSAAGRGRSRSTPHKRNPRTVCYGPNGSAHPDASRWSGPL